jgi:hypothetical protein
VSYHEAVGRACASAALIVAIIPLAAATDGTPLPDVERLSESLRALYEGPRAPWERWRRRSPTVTLPGGEVVRREAAYRDRPDFAAAAGRLMASRAGDEGPLGAWLLGTAVGSQSDAARSLLSSGLFAEDPRTAFEAACALGRIGDRSSLAGLERAARTASSAEVRTAAAWAASRVAERLDPAPGAARPSAPGPDASPLATGFVRGVSWWREGQTEDGGRESLRALASLGVDWVSIHTWDPQQRGGDDPDLP